LCHKFKVYTIQPPLPLQHQHNNATTDTIPDTPPVVSTTSTSSYETCSKMFFNGMNDFNSVIMVRIYIKENNIIFLLLIVQEGCKGLLYMVLHARVVLDLCEHLEQEISFEQVEGDFDSFQGKWLLEQLGNHHTLLKYIVESKMRKDSFLSEAIMEEVCHNIILC
jgi:hypothetical protein